MSETLTKLIGTDSILIGTVVPFLLVLTLVVFVHEMGHYLVGRWCGIGVKAFSIGFGPELVGFNDRRGTRWKLSAIPLGGYVKFAGDENGASIADRGAIEAMSEEERKVAFHTQPVWKRAATVFAGPLANFILSIAIFAVFFGIYGKLVVDPIVSELLPGSVAEKAGFLPGDKFLKVDGVDVQTFADVQHYIGRRAGEEIRFTLERKGQQIDLTAAPEVRQMDDPLGNKVKMSILGIKVGNENGNFKTIKLSPVEALQESVSQAGFIASETGHFFARLVKGREDKCQLGGPVKIATMAGQAAKRGYDWLIQLAAMLSMGIGLLNLVPLPPLDGGHLLFYGVEAVMRRPVSAKVQDMVFRAGGVLVLTFMAFVFYNDLFAC